MAEFRTLADLLVTTLPDDQLLTKGAVDILKRNDQFTAAMVASARVSDSYNLKGTRTTSHGGADWIGDANDTITSEASEVSGYNYDLKTIIRQFDVSKIGKNLGSKYQDVSAQEANSAVVGMSYEIAEKVITGDGTNDTIEGLNNQLTNTFSVEVSGGFQISDMERLYDEVLARQDLVYVGNPKTCRAVSKELRAESQGMDYGTLAGTNMRVPTYLGIPLLRNPYFADGELVLLDRNEFVLYFAASADPDDSQSGIFAAENVGPLEDKFRKRMRIYTHIHPILHDTQGAAKLTGVI